MNHRPSKPSSRFALNQMFMGAVLMIFSIAWVFDPMRLNLWVLIQLTFSMPLLLTSSLSYSKCHVRKEKEVWDSLAEITQIISYALLLNAIGLMIYSVSNIFVTIAYFVLIWILNATFTSLNIFYHRRRFVEYSFKMFLSFIMQVLFGLLPIFMGWV